MNNNSEFMPVECLNVPKVLFYDKQYLARKGSAVSPFLCCPFPFIPCYSDIVQK